MKNMRRPPGQIKFTKEGLADIVGEYEKLKQARPSAVKELSRARELGDLSENGLYHAAKANLRSIDGQMKRLSYQIKVANVVASKKYVVEQNGREVTYEIVGDFEADPKQNKISSNSPIGSCLSGKREGEVAEIQTPNGKLSLKILKVL